MVNSEWWKWVATQAREDDWRRIEERAEIAPNRFRTLGSAIVGEWPVDGLGPTESAIEQMLAEALIEPAAKWGYEIIPQYELGPFRYDFALKNRKGKLVALVECDGREFHSTPEQLSNDAKKDALAEEHGLLMFRLSGVDICKHPQRCADNIIFGVYPQ